MSPMTKDLLRQTAEMADCQFCGEDHESFARTMPDGSTHVYQSAEERARRIAAAKATNERFRLATEDVTVPAPRISKAEADAIFARALRPRGAR